ncbi:cadherin repeat domain-containing protein [bacterium]|jgi:hypothetical protein|nr:cadherin repeat domain-containing protein [bacterium]
MQQREKLLAGGLGAVVVLWFGLPIYDSTFVEPINALTAEEERLQEESNEKFDQQIALRRKEIQLADWRKSSLPPDPLNAQRLYQEWLTDLAQISGFEKVSIKLERRVSQGNVFTTIPVTLEAKATIQELAQFLERFESVDLLHRISTCDAISPASEGNPDLTVTITAEGLSMNSAPERSRLFPLIELPDGLSKADSELTLAGLSKDFPTTGGFRVWINDEFANVTEVNGDAWTLQRGVSKTFSEDHLPGTTVELFPIVDEGKDNENATEAMWSLSLFTKPAPKKNYDPKLATTSPPPAIRGENWDWKLNVDEWNPAFGSPMFSLLESPEGMKLDERTGSVAWDVDSQFEVGIQSLQVMVWGSASKEAGFTSKVNLRVRDPNEPPELEQGQPLRFYLGRTSSKQLVGNDPDGENSRLKYSVEGTPEGMQLDERTGTLTWTPAESLDAQTIDLQVTVTDSDEDPKSITRTIPISVEEDSARYTFLTTTFKREFAEGAAEWEAYLYDRATNKTTQLKVGQQITVADFEMDIQKIDEDFVEVQRPDGRFRILFEHPLVEMVKLAEPTVEASVLSTEEPSKTDTEAAPEVDSPTDTSESTEVTTETEEPAATSAETEQE